jgi:hypothetical protein
MPNHVVFVMPTHIVTISMPTHAVTVSMPNYVVVVMPTHIVTVSMPTHALASSKASGAGACSADGIRPGHIPNTTLDRYRYARRNRGPRVVCCVLRDVEP